MGGGSVRPCSNGKTHLSLWVAHYIYTTGSVQYKRLFELPAA
ncbi:hypothetical protein C4J88_4033 [Pseudomonas sp. R4-39-08]|nr:hypothetical protein C4J88_4033 [Pseudomonas sp. R4-39-08]